MSQNIEPGDGVEFTAETGLGPMMMEGTVERVEGDTIWLREPNPEAARRDSIFRVHKGGLPGTLLGGDLENDL